MRGDRKRESLSTPLPIEEPAKFCPLDHEEAAKASGAGNHTPNLPTVGRLVLPRKPEAANHQLQCRLHNRDERGGVRESERERVREREREREQEREIERERERERARERARERETCSCEISALFKACTSLTVS